ncbi:iron compounds ABC transporter, permease protein [Treponema primitia ZAS-2]|uniref:Iron compounds ABC transporter, permease protein n=1 Tax=Treponema primitia (strain ATCC BAA-887 / DSM 12427 / ZAS-2) TaxID=545694 RepID=F5YH76_TREPZ|nr:iron ABC transporter permease [Treponema primitia]AEF86354.1 iron compounds ABC transporter, permease protein [Treponema primitia ZAS-2]
MADSSSGKLGASGAGLSRRFPAAAILGLLLVAAVLVSLSLGRYPIPLGALITRLLGGTFATPQMEAIFFNVRLPRIILACLVGCSLAAAGASYQGVFQNPLAAPDILGASSGAATGATLAILMRLPGPMITIFAFFASIITIALVMFIGNQTRGRNIVGLILAGLMISSLNSAAISFMKLMADPNNVLPEIVYWLMGSLAKTKPADVAFVFIPMTLGLVPLFIFRWRINLLTLSEDEAQSMGVNVKRTRALVIVCSTLITAAAVSVSGIIGWAGLVIPHLTRRFVGNDYQKLMPATMLFGALFLLVIDNISRNLFATEVPLGILTSLVGAPFFLWLITRKGDLW